MYFDQKPGTEVFALSQSDDGTVEIVRGVIQEVVVTWRATAEQPDGVGTTSVRVARPVDGKLQIDEYEPHRVVEHVYDLRGVVESFLGKLQGDVEMDARLAQLRKEAAPALPKPVPNVHLVPNDDPNAA